MDKEILFRAKRLDNGEWIEGLLTIMWGQYHIISPDDENTAYPIDADTICQFTGLTDEKSNKKVWEHDVVKYHFGDDVAEIKLGEYQSCFDSKETCHVGFYVDWQKGFLRKDLGYWVKMIDCNVIGNIFDNPDLIQDND